MPTTPYVTYLPAREAFIPQTLDHYNGNNGFPPGASNLIAAGVSCLVAASPLEGGRSRIQSGFGYTHVILMDPGQAIADSYAGTGANPSTTADILALPSTAGNGGSGNNYWYCVITFLGKIAGLGTKRVVLADRRYVGNPSGLL